MTVPFKMSATRFAQAAMVGLLLNQLSAGEVRADNSVIRIGIPTFPSGGGVPLRGYANPSILTYSAMFDGLTYLDNDGAFQPGLATSWTQVDDLTWRFNLRNNVTFSNGEPFNAETVTFYINLLKRPDSAVFPVQRELGILDSARALDTHTVEISTSVPAPLLPRILAAMRVVPPVYWDSVGHDGFQSAPIGTGPFEVQTWNDSAVLLDAFQGSWRPPKVNRIELMRVPEAIGRLNAILAEDIDIAISIAPDDEPVLQSVGAKLQDRRTGSTLVWTFITADETPLRDARVRRALNMAIDRKALINAFLGGKARIPNQAALPEAFGFNPSLPALEYDPESAKQLLKEAGYPDGFPMKVEVVVGSTPNDTAIYQQMGVYLSQIGVDVEIRTITLAQLVTGIGEGKWTGQSFNLDFSLFPALDGISPLRIHSCLKRVAWFCDPKASPLIESVFNEADLSRREALTREVQAYVRSELPALIIHEGVVFDGIGSSIRGYRADFGWIPFHEMEKVAPGSPS